MKWTNWREHTASVRSQENHFFRQQFLTKDVAQDGRSLVASGYAVLQIANHLVDVELLHAAILAGLFHLLVHGPFLNTEKLASHVPRCVDDSQSRDVVAKGRANSSLTD